MESEHGAKSPEIVHSHFLTRAAPLWDPAPLAVFSTPLLVAVAVLIRLTRLFTLFPTFAVLVRRNALGRGLRGTCALGLGVLNGIITEAEQRNDECAD